MEVIADSVFASPHAFVDDQKAKRPAAPTFAQLYQQHISAAIGYAAHVMTTTPKRSPARMILLAIAILLLASLVIFAQLPGSSQFMHVLHKAGHPSVFAVISLLVLWILQENRSTALLADWQKYAVALFVAILIGALTEVLQQFTHRNSRLTDVMSDCIGAVAGLALHAAWFGPGRNSNQRVLKPGLTLLGMSALVVAASPMAWSLSAYAWRDEQFPVLAQCRNRLDLYFISKEARNVHCVDLPAKWSGTNTERALRVALDNGPYPGVSLKEPYPRWRGFRKLAVDITNPGDTDLELVIRVNDRQHNGDFADRFNGRQKLPAKTRTTVVVALQGIESAPKGRAMKMDEISSVIIFALQPKRGGEFFVSRIWLE